MVAKKKRYTALLAVIATFFLLAGALFYLAVPVHAGTNTDGMWQIGQTQNLIPVLHEGDVREQGWNIDEPNAQATAAERDGGWAILAGNGDSDLGNSDYTGGIYYVIELSAADQAKANAGQLSLSASARTWIQGASARHRLSIRAEFFNTADISGEGFHTEKVTLEPKRETLPRTETISMEQRNVPSGTVKIKIWFSNQGSLDGKPWLGSMACYLHDSTAPSFEGASLNDIGTIDPEKNIAIEGNTVKYLIQFNEKVSVLGSGTAILNLNGQLFVTSSTMETIEENGKTSVAYMFTLPQSQNSGTLSLSSVSGLTVKDEAGNEFTYSGSPSAETLTYYGTMSVTTELSDVEMDGEVSAKYGSDYTATLLANKGYNLPSGITVTVGGATIASAGYTYDPVSGKITVNGMYITGDISIKAAGEAKEITVTFDKQSGADGTSSITAVYDENMPDITIPVRTGYTFAGYYTQIGGTGILYYDKSGKGVRICDFDAPLTLYAYWIANDYTIEFDGNKPENASGNVMGEISAVERTYDDGAIALPTNGFLLTGWTFKGWATSENGGVVYTDMQAVKNLTDVKDAVVTLYAVWEQNVYTVNYNPNRPAGASGTVTGSTAESSHVYDTASGLTVNGFALAGWTFKGWSTTEGGGKVYDDGVSVSTLVSENGGSITLYAVWEQNVYTVNYNPNKPAAASGIIQGTMFSSSHVYDTASGLTENGFSLTGWTFKGWATTEDGDKLYDDGVSVSTLVSENGGSITLYAVWEANSHTITLNAMGGSNSGFVGAIYDSVLPDIAAVPARYGYNFLGYFDSVTGGVQYYGADGKAFGDKTFTVDESLVLYAQWSPVTYTVELYSEGKYLGTLDGIVFGELTLPSAEKLSLSRPNYDFVGWNIYDEQNWAMYSADTLYSIGLTGQQGGVVVLYASWQEKPLHSLFYDANGGFGAPATTQVHEKETISLSVTVPTRKNYTFLGWSDSAGSQTVQYHPGEKFTMGGEGVTLYAVWQHNPSLSYDANGGTFVGSVSVSYPAASETVTIISVIPKLEGYVFEGWSENPDASEADYRAGEEFLMPDNDTVLYAVWKTKQYTVTSEVPDGYQINGLSEKYSFNETASFSVTGTSPKVYINGEFAQAGENGVYTFVVKGEIHIFVADGSKLSLIYSGNGGTGSPSDNSSYISGSIATVSSIEPHLQGYTFVGWSADKNSESAEYTAGSTVSFAGEDIILYAVWKANTYTVTYDSSGGTGEMDDDVFTFGTVGYLSGNMFEKTGHTFIGWALSDGGEVVYGDSAAVSDLCSDNNGNVTLYAVWEQTVTVITFAPDGGTEVNSSVSVVYGDSLTSDGLVVPFRAGYIFAGYYTQPDGAGDMIFDESVNVAFAEIWDRNVGTLTLYPKWIPFTYTVVYISGHGIVGEQSAVYGTSFNLKTAAELGITMPDGYHFAGWSVIPSGQTAAYSDGQLIYEALTQKDGDTVYLYAVSEADEKYSVIYHANGGSNAPVDNNTYFTGEMVSLGGIIPEREGYIFGGWSYDPNSISVDFPYENGQFTSENVAMPEGGMELYAVWIAGETLQSQIDELEDKAATLADAVAALENADSGFTDQLRQLSNELQSAQEAIASLNDIYATDEELAAAVNQLKELLALAEAELEQKITQVQANLDKAVAELTDAVAANKADIEEKLAEIDSAYKAADALINSDISALKSEDEKLKESIAALDSAYKAADMKLQEAIDKLQANLDKAVAELTDSVAANKADIEEKVAEIDSAYKAADALIKSDIAALIARDSEIEESIAALVSAYKSADIILLGSINRVQTNLNNAVAELNNSVSANKADIEEKIAALDVAYKAADAIINSEIAALIAGDSELRQSIAALDVAYKAADEALWAGIRQVQENLDALEQKTAKTEFTFMIVSSVLSFALIVLIVTLIVKVIRKRHLQK